MLHQDWEIITFFAELRRNEEEHEKEQMWFWRSSLQAQQPGNMQPCSGQGNRKRCTREVLSPACSCWLESVGLDTIIVWTEGTYTSHRYSHAIWLGARLTHHAYLANTDDKTYLTIHSQAQLRVHNNGVLFLSLLIGMSLAMQGHVLLEEWEKWKKNLFSKSCINHINTILLLLLIFQCFQWLNLQLVCMS